MPGSSELHGGEAPLPSLQGLNAALPRKRFEGCKFHSSQCFGIATHFTPPWNDVDKGEGSHLPGEVCYNHTVPSWHRASSASAILLHSTGWQLPPSVQTALGGEREETSRKQGRKEPHREQKMWVRKFKLRPKCQRCAGRENLDVKPQHRLRHTEREINQIRGLSGSFPKQCRRSHTAGEHPKTADRRGEHLCLEVLGTTGALWLGKGRVRRLISQADRQIYLSLYITSFPQEETSVQ